MLELLKARGGVLNPVNEPLRKTIYFSSMEKLAKKVDNVYEPLRSGASERGGGLPKKPFIFLCLPCMFHS